MFDKGKYQMPISSLQKEKKKDDTCFFKETKVDQDKKRKAAKQSTDDTGPKQKFELHGHKFFNTYSGLTDEEANKEAGHAGVCKGAHYYSGASRIFHWTRGASLTR